MTETETETVAVMEELVVSEGLTLGVTETDDVMLPESVAERVSESDDETLPESERLTVMERERLTETVACRKRGVWGRVSGARRGWGGGGGGGGGGDPLS